MEKRYQVFVSSTYDDLIEERKEVTQAILKCECFPAGMELFQAANKGQWEIIKRVIDDSDFYLLILAGRYGSMGVNDKGIKMGFTEMEFDYAVSKEKPILVFLHRKPESIPAKFVEKKNSQRLKKFKEKVCNCRLVSCWENKDQLHGVVLDSLMKAKKNTPEAVGWIRANKYKKPENKELPLSINDIISKLEQIESKYEQMKLIKSFDHNKQKELFNNERFIRYFLRFLDNNIPESEIFEAITLIPHYPLMDRHIINIIISEAKIINAFNDLCVQAEYQNNNKGTSKNP